MAASYNVSIKQAITNLNRLLIRISDVAMYFRTGLWAKSVEWLIWDINYDNFTNPLKQTVGNISSVLLFFCISNHLLPLLSKFEYRTANVVSVLSGVLLTFWFFPGGFMRNTMKQYFYVGLFRISENSNLGLFDIRVSGITFPCKGSFGTVWIVMHWMVQNRFHSRERIKESQCNALKYEGSFTLLDR